MPASVSGEMLYGVPTTVFAIELACKLRATPKSPSLQKLSAERKILADLTSARDEGRGINALGRAAHDEKRQHR